MTLLVDLELLLRLVVAAAFGYVIGLERRWAGHSAGHRTFALCAMGSALFAVISEKAFPSGDPARVAAGVVTGLGFLGAGMILKGESGEVRGLTTAAGIWTVGGIGLAIGTGEYILGIGAAILTVFLLSSERLLHVEERVDRKRGEQ